MPIPSGDSFAGYRIVKRLGADATSELYLAEHAGSPDPVVLRIVAPQQSADPSYHRAFLTRLDSVADLTHPHLPRILDYGDHDGRLWSAVEWLDGNSCSLLLKRTYHGGMPPKAVVYSITAAAEALDYLHGHGVAHGAVRPARIQLPRPDAGPDARILVNGHDAVPATVHDAFAADRSALAMLAFYISTAAVPDRKRPMSVSVLRPEFAAADDVITAALADPRAYASNREFAEALAAALQVDGRMPVSMITTDTLPATPPPPPVTRPPAPSTSPRKPLPKTLTAVGAVLAVLLLVAVATFFVRDRYYQSQAAPPPPEEPATSEASPAPLPPPGPPVCGEGDALLAEMKPRQKLAQLLAVGVTGLADAQQVVANEQVGGIMIGSWTDKSMLGADLVALSASASPLPLAVSTDEEGGRVSRLSSEIGVQPSAREIVTQGWTVDQVYDEALRRGQAMRNLGITVDFAPVVDVSDQPDDTVIGDRSFSNDPAVVTDYAGAYARGLHDAGVQPVFKHFPGHGQASGDSHEGGVTTPNLESLKARDLIPYQTLVNKYGAAVMIGHMNVPGLTANGEQASLSPAAYQLLRDGVGYGAPAFNGIIYTDDLSSMGAINQQYTVPQAVLKALQAGADIALWITTDDVTAVLDRLEQALANGELNQAAVDASVLRVAAAKGKSPDCGG